MNSKELLNLYKEKINSNPFLAKAFEIECDFWFDDNIDLKKDILICGEESNYEMYPFGKESTGGIYCLLNNEYIGYISSEGGCGIICKNINDFFNLLATCKELISYFYKGVFDSFENFEKKYNEVNTNVKFYNIHLYNEFIDDNKFTTDVSTLYNIFKSGIITEPSFILRVGPTQYDDIFFSEQEEIERLRNKH